MKKSIESLKAIVTDGMKLIRQSGDPVVIRRFPNNIIKIHNKSVSWETLLDLLVNGEYELDIKDSNSDLSKLNHKKWGGYRFPGPGKKLGRNKVKDKKVPVTISIRQSIKEKLLDILEVKEIDKNEFFETIINIAFEQLENNKNIPLRYCD